MASKRNILFLCTGNTARSILAEGIMAALGGDRFSAHSAGSHPKGIVNPYAIRALEAGGFPVDGLRSKSWDEFARPGAPVMDIVVTVCDNAAGEACPFWPGAPVSAHWGIADPAGVEGSESQKEAAFAKAFGEMRDRIEALLALPLDAMSAETLKAELDRIGRLPGATA
jgi:arsenate reductase